ncbi:MAG: hypothetical protein V4658_07425 [Bacteroidota bacterium]
METINHIWSFSTVGGVKRVNLESGTDLLHLASLDQKLWTALGCPVEGLEIDRATLRLIDKDGDGQIRVPEVLTAVSWVLNILKDPDDLLKQDNTLPLSVISNGTEAGRQLLASAKIILSNLGKPDADHLTIEDTSDLEKIFASTRFNGDGIITEDSANTPQSVLLLNEVMACMGSLTDRGGKQGVDQPMLENFIQACYAYKTWFESADDSVRPFGAATGQAHLVYQKVKTKIDDYFIRSHMAGYDPASAHVLNVLVAQVEAISPKDLSGSLEEIAAYPLSKIEAGMPLKLIESVNPAWQNELALFKQQVSDPLFSASATLSEAQWKTVKAQFVAYEKWMAEKQGAEAELLGILRVNEIIAGNTVQELYQLVMQDKELEEEANNMILVDQLVRYYRDLFKLLKNFVTFYDFYSPGHKAIFQAGTLFIDQRSCDLCIRVNDIARHAEMSAFSGMFLMYCECASRSTNEKITIAVALTNGDIDNLVPGRNAIFYDRNGLDWDATVVKIIDNPISMKQAFWSPYRKVSRFIETQINKVAAAQDNKVTGDVTKGIEDTRLKNEPAQAPPPPFDVGKFVGIFAAIGLALGAIGTAVASVIAGFMGLAWWKMPIAVLGIMLLISGPAMVMAYLKLRKRNLAPILDANGWAVNASAVINIQFGNTLTHIAELPKGAKVNLNDPFTKKKRPVLPMIILGIVVIALVLYLLDRYGFIQVHF